MRARQRCILREGMISSAIEALHSVESRETRRQAVVVAVEAGVPHILPAAVPHTAVAAGACNILCKSDSPGMFCRICEKILAPDGNVW